MGTVRIGMCQIACLDGDRKGNLARIENAVAEAAEAGAEIACLPEMALYGWVNSDAHRRAQPIPGEDAQRLCAIAQQHGVALAPAWRRRTGSTSTTPQCSSTARAGFS